MVNYKRGFTLIEITIVLSIITIVISFGMILDSRVLGRGTFHAEQSKIISLLQKSRSRAMSNVYGQAHGFCYDHPNYVIFYGRATCLPKDNTDDIVPANPNLTVSFSPPAPVIFNRLSGSPTDDIAHNIRISDGVNSSDIIINYEGTIEW
jgi:prepilin-type N-terminal cleavage/methylation domain-containing protein